jgi:hypothetical protein
MELDIDPNVFERDGSRGRGGSWYRLSTRALDRLRPLFARFGTDLRGVQIAFEPDLGQSVTSGNYIRFGGDFLLSSLARGQTLILVHELVHVAQAQRLGTVRVVARGMRDLIRSGPGERHYDYSPEIKRETLDTLDLVDARYDLEAIADWFADLAWAAGRYRMFK